MNDTETVVMKILERAKEPLSPRAIRDVAASVQSLGLSASGPRNAGMNAVRSACRRLALAGMARRNVLPSGLLAYTRSEGLTAVLKDAPGLGMALDTYLKDVSRALARLHKVENRGDGHDERELSVGGEKLSGTVAQLIETLDARQQTALGLKTRLEEQK
jgi:hypothetical protein